MQTLLRRLVQFVFGMQAVAFLPALPLWIYYVTAHGLPNAHITMRAVYSAGGFFSGVGAIYAVAWWTLKQGRRWMRVWGIAGSILNLLFSLPLLFVHHLQAFNFFWCLPVAGFGGMYIFLTPMAVEAGPRRPTRRPRIPGDGTNAVIDVLVWIVGAGVGICGTIWGRKYLAENDIAYPHGIAMIAQLIVILLVSVLIHEFGHAFVGWGVGMKLQLFSFGPFTFKKRAGKWRFDFEAGKIFGAGGATGNVPGGTEFRVWHALMMIAAGPMINLLTGAMALSLGMTSDPQSWWQMDGALIMFGIYSLVGGMVNLLPQRTQEHYSDGARIYQLLAGGPAADIYFAFEFVSSSLVTPLRPADYDMELLDRAVAAAQGVELIHLRTFQYEHFLDLEETGKALEAFEEVTIVCDQFKGAISAGLLQNLVFGAGYLKRDSALARRYWERMKEAEKKSKQPLLRDADYWIAESALYWSERNVQAANSAWERGAVLANQLPAAGAYEFDRHRYMMVRSAIEGVSSKLFVSHLEPVLGQAAFDAAD